MSPTCRRAAAPTSGNHPEPDPDLAGPEAWPPRAQAARRYRDEAEQELGKLGYRIHLRTRPGKPGAAGIEARTAFQPSVNQGRPSGNQGARSGWSPDVGAGLRRQP